MFITLTSDYLYVLAMLKTTPLVVTIGLSLTIPLSVLGEFALGKHTAGQVIIGALLVLISPVIVGTGMDDPHVGNPKREELGTGIRVAGDEVELQSLECLRNEATST